MRKMRILIFTLFIEVLMIMMNTSIISSSGHEEKSDQQKLFEPFLLIEPEKTDIFETELLNINVSINNPRPLFGNFYIYIIYGPSSPQNFIVDELYRRVVGKSELISYSDLERGVKVKNCSFTVFQSFEEGYIIAKIVPLWLSKMPRLLGLYLNLWNYPRWISNTENINVYNILDELENIGVQSYKFTHKNEERGWKRWDKKEGYYKIKADSLFNVTVILFNKLNIDVDDAWIQVSLIKPSKFGVGVGEDTVVITSGGSKINKSTNGEIHFTKIHLTGYIPLNIENGQYRTKATVYLPYIDWIPTPNSDYGDYLYVHGGIESSLISNSQLKDIKNTLFMLIPTLFVLGLIFAAFKKRIYQKMDEKLERNGKLK
ncbi:MAG TPA: hypothetical protein ENI33_02685 [Thermoplasmatales archaeon]|nr:hypothetical protein [Thermoplasmatales archaeon]